MAAAFWSEKKTKKEPVGAERSDRCRASPTATPSSRTRAAQWLIASTCDKGYVIWLLLITPWISEEHIPVQPHHRLQLHPRCPVIDRLHLPGRCKGFPL